MRALGPILLCAGALLLAALVSATPSALAATAYVAKGGDNTVSVINTATNKVEAPPIAVGALPQAIAITPDGKSAYVVDDFDDTVSVINTATNKVEGPPIAVGARPTAIAITPDGKSAYVANAAVRTVSVINTATNKVEAPPIAVGRAPEAIAITPDGKSAYVANFNDQTVSVINTATNKVELPPIAVGNSPIAIVITPDGKSAYVANRDSNSVSVINTATNKVELPQINVGTNPIAIAITPDGKSAYVVKGGDNTVSVINIATNQLRGSPIAPGPGPAAIAITPNQPPTASFTTVPTARPGVLVTFNATASTDPDGQVADYSWDFGDGHSAQGPTPTHTYAVPGSYKVTLTVTDNEGCSSSLLFTGQTAFCVGNALATATKTETVGKAETLTLVNPGVALRCPKSAGHRGCKFKLQALTKAHRGSPESAVAGAKLKAGRSAILTLKPKPAFADRLAAARSVLVKESVRIGALKRTRIVTLKIVQ